MLGRVGAQEHGTWILLMNINSEDAKIIVRALYFAQGNALMMLENTLQPERGDWMRKKNEYRRVRKYMCSKLGIECGRIGIPR